MRGDVHVRFGGRERRNGIRETGSPRSVPTLHLSFSRAGAELLFQVFADRYERASLLITSNLAFSDWGQVFQGERMTAALLDRLTHRCHIFEMNGESYRFRESVKAKKEATKAAAAKHEK